ncbi:MAG: hypothetical protein V4478_04190 [Patescibacteria group bacterium]
MVRLPSVGADQDTWGDLLNQYLEVSHTDTGRMKPLVVLYPFDTSITPNIDTTEIADVGALSADIAIANPTGTPVDGQVLTFRLAQDSTGGRAITWDTLYAFDTSTTVPTIPSAMNAVWEISFRWNATTSLWQLSENSASVTISNISAAAAVTLTSWTYAQTFALTTITRDMNETIVSASIVWPDGSTGTFTTDTASAIFPGAIDAYHVTYVPVSGPTSTVTQPLLTRDATGAVTAQPVLVIT